MLPLEEVQDGLLISPDKVLMKARDPELFPDNVREYFSDKERVQYSKIEIGLEKVTVTKKDKRAVYSVELFNYIRSLGRIECFLSNVPLPGEDIELFPLFAKYKFGWICLAPLEA